MIGKVLRDAHREAGRLAWSDPPGGLDDLLDRQALGKVRQDEPFAEDVGLHIRQESEMLQVTLQEIVNAVAAISAAISCSPPATASS